MVKDKCSQELRLAPYPKRTYQRHIEFEDWGTWDRYSAFIEKDAKSERLRQEWLNLMDMKTNYDDALAKAGIIDLKSINALKHLESRQCVAVGNIASNYPIFTEVRPQAGVVMGGETRKLVG